MNFSYSFFFIKNVAEQQGNFWLVSCLRLVSSYAADLLFGT